MRKLSLSFVLLLSILLLPIIAFSDAQDTLNKSIGHIVSVQDENGAWSRLKGELPSETEPTSWAVKVLAMNNTEQDRIEKGVNFILKDQRPDGSWNNNTAHTAFAILALKQANKGGDAIKQGVDYIKTVQDERGGFKRMGKEGPPLTIYTAVVLCALKESGYKKDDPSVKKAIEWLISCQNSDGGYGMPKGAPSLSLSTAWTIRALLAFGMTSSIPPIQDAVRYLLTAQKPSGGFSPVPGAPEDPEATAYAIMALSSLEDKKDIIRKTYDYLAKAQQADGAFISSTPVQLNKTPKKNTQSAAFVAWALSEIR